ncbi:MAG: hypothetical protein K2P81_04200 [Bacteriovoracaceae bacterium]|nr:hypothetical protein [Bacteriovoracaceae bacterium]
MANMDGTWLSIIEYSQIKKVSISTIRRHIKANLLKWKEEDGKYLIWTSSTPNEISQKQEAESLRLKLELERLRQSNRILQEELSEAQMLIKLYETNPQLAQEMNL